MGEGIVVVLVRVFNYTELVRVQNRQLNFLLLTQKYEH